MPDPIIVSKIAQVTEVDPNVFTGLKDTSGSVKTGKPYSVKDNNYGVSINAAIPGQENYNEALAYEQGTAATIANGLVRTASTAISEFIKTPFYLGGLDNGMLKAIDETKNYINEDLVPVYISKAVQEGKFFDKIASPEWWASTGADGMGFFLAMMLPGRLIAASGIGTAVANTIAKGVGAASESSGLLKSLARISGGRLASSYDDLVKFAQAGKTPFVMSADANKIVIAEKLAQARIAGNVTQVARLEKELAMIGNMSNEYFATQSFKRGVAGAMSATVNTLAEASAEAANTKENVYAKLKAQHPNWTEEELQAEAGKRASQVFNQNLALLFVSNLLDEAWIWKSFSTKMPNNAFAKRSMQEVIAAEFDAAKLTGKTLTKGQQAVATLKGLGKGIVKEGFFEEGTQYEIQNTAEDIEKPVAERGNITLGLFDPLAMVSRSATPIFENITDVLSGDFFKGSVEKQESVFLGGLLGGGASAVGDRSTLINEHKALYGGTYNDGWLSKLRGLKPRTVNGVINDILDIHNSQVDLNKSLDELRNDGLITPDGKLKAEALVGKSESLINKMQLTVDYHQAVKDGNVVLAQKLEESLWKTELLNIARQEGGADIMDEAIESIYIPKYIEQYKTMNDGQAPSEQHVKDLTSRMKEIGKDTVVGWETISNAHNVNHIAHTPEQQDLFSKFDNDTLAKKLNAHFNYTSSINHNTEIKKILREAGLAEDLFENSDQYLKIEELEKPLYKKSGKKWLKRNEEGKYEEVKYMTELENYENSSEEGIAGKKAEYEAQVKLFEEANLEIENANKIKEEQNKINQKNKDTLIELNTKGFIAPLFMHSYAKEVLDEILKGEKSTSEIQKEMYRKMVDELITEINKAQPELSKTKEGAEMVQEAAENMITAQTGLNGEFNSWMEYNDHFIREYRKEFLNLHDKDKIQKEWEELVKRDAEQKQATEDRNTNVKENRDLMYNIAKEAEALGYKGVTSDPIHIPYKTAIYFYDKSSESIDENGNQLPGKLYVLYHRKGYTDKKGTVHQDGLFLYDALEKGSKKFLPFRVATYKRMLEVGFEMLPLAQGLAIKQKYDTIASNQRLITKLENKIEEYEKLYDSRRAHIEKLKAKIENRKLQIEDSKKLLAEIEEEIRKEEEILQNARKKRKRVKEIKQRIQEWSVFQSQVENEIELFQESIISAEDEIDSLEKASILNQEYVNYLIESVVQMMNPQFDEDIVKTLDDKFRQDMDKLAEEIADWQGKTKKEFLSEMALATSTRDRIYETLQKIEADKEFIREHVEMLQDVAGRLRGQLHHLLNLNSALKGYLSASKNAADGYIALRNDIEDNLRTILNEELSQTAIDEIIDLIQANVAVNDLYDYLSKNGYLKDQSNERVQFDTKKIVRKLLGLQRRTNAIPDTDVELNAYRAIRDALKRHVDAVEEMGDELEKFNNIKRFVLAEQLLADLIRITAEEENTYDIATIRGDFSYDDYIKATDDIDSYTSDQIHKTSFFDFIRDFDTQDENKRGRNKLIPIDDEKANTTARSMLPIPNDKPNLAYSTFMSTYSGKNTDGDVLQLISYQEVLNRIAKGETIYQKVKKEIEERFTPETIDALRPDSVFTILINSKGEFYTQKLSDTEEYFVIGVIPDSLVNGNFRRVRPDTHDVLGYVAKMETRFEIIKWGPRKEDDSFTIKVKVNDPAIVETLNSIGFEEIEEGIYESEIFANERDRDFKMTQLADLTYKEERMSFAKKGTTIVKVLGASNGFPTLVKDENGNPVFNSVMKVVDKSKGFKFQKDGKLVGGHIHVFTHTGERFPNSIGGYVSYPAGMAAIIFDDGTHMPVKPRNLNREEAEFLVNVIISSNFNSAVFHHKADGTAVKIAEVFPKKDIPSSVVSDLIHWGMPKVIGTKQLDTTKEGIWTSSQGEPKLRINTNYNFKTGERRKKFRTWNISIAELKSDPTAREELINYLLTKERRIPFEQFNQPEGNLGNNLKNQYTIKGKQVVLDYSAKKHTYNQDMLLGTESVLQTHIIRPNATFSGDNFGGSFVGGEVTIPQWQGRYLVYQTEEEKPKLKSKPASESTAPTKKREPRMDDPDTWETVSEEDIPDNLNKAPRRSEVAETDIGTSGGVTPVTTTTSTVPTAPTALSKKMSEKRGNTESKEDPECKPQ